MMCYPRSKLPHMHNRNNTDFSIAAQCEWVARLFAIVVAALGLAVLAGWAFDIAALKSVAAGWVTMKVNTAIGFLLAGTCLFFAGCGADAPAWRRLRVALAAAVGLLGLLTLGEYMLGADFGIDQLLFSADPEPVSHAAPGRMAAATAAGFALTGFALAMLDSIRWRVLALAAALAGNLIGMLAILGYVYEYDVAALYGFGAYSSVSLHTAAGFMTVNLGVLLARPRIGLMAIVTSNTAGGVMVRRLLPLAILSPFLIGWLHVECEKNGLISPGFNIVIVTLTYITLFSAFIWRTGSALCANDQKLRDLYQLSPMGIVLTDLKGNYVESNQAFRNMSGYSGAELKNINFLALISAAGEAQQVASLERTGLYGPDEKKFIRKDGRAVPVRLNGMLITGDHGQQFICSIVEDITERQQAEQAQVHRIIEAAPDPTLLVGSDGIITFANKVAQSTFGYSLNGLMGQSVDNLVPFESDHAWFRGKDANSLPVAAVHKDGSEFPVEVSLSPIRMDGQAVVIASILDITERKRAAELLQQSFSELRRLSDHQQNIKEKERKRIAQDIHDDLGQNLLALKMDVATLYMRTRDAHPKLNQRVSLVLDNINATINSVKSIMNDLRPATLELGLRAGVEWQLKQFERMSGIACRLAAPEAEAEFELDEHRTVAVFRILQESLSNVVRHAQATKVEVTLCRDECGFSMKVKDNGKGLELGDRRKVNSFGLVGIKERTHALGGKLTIESSTSNGTVLSIFIGREDRIESVEGGTVTA